MIYGVERKGSIKVFIVARGNPKSGWLLCQVSLGMYSVKQTANLLETAVSWDLSQSSH
jgi:hypothetical protein